MICYSDKAEKHLIKDSGVYLCFYAGVATFCRVRSAFSTDEVALPVAAEEGFTGLLENSRGFESQKDEWRPIARGLEDFSRDELLHVDSEGRCVITDHGHFSKQDATDSYFVTSDLWSL